MALILASSSPYRKQQLESLGIDFIAISPDIDESLDDHMTPWHAAEYLALAKAQKLAASYPKDRIIGCDQLAYFNGERIGKPYEKDKAFTQLQRFSGQQIDFISALALVNTETGNQQVGHTTTRVHFRQLTDASIRNYINQDKPWHCAGSFKIEQHGMLLFESVESNDPSALIGLPVLLLHRFLRNENIDLLVR